MLSVRDSDALQATVLVMKSVERDVVREINTRTRTAMNPVWQSLVQTEATTALDSRVLAKGTRIKAGNPPVLVAASSRRPLRGGLVPADQWHAVEFGAADDHTTKYERKNRTGTGTHTVTRHTGRQLPRRYRKGRVVHPAVEQLVPRLASLWVQTVVRTVMDAAERAAR